MTNPSIFAAFERMWQHIVALVGNKANIDHNHDDVYYTETEIDSMLQSKADSEHTHNDDYDAKGSADTALDSAKEYTDTKTSGLASTSSVNTSISTHNTSTSAHDDIRALIDDLSTAVNNFLDVDDTTKDQLSEVLQLIENNKGTLESLTSSKVNVSDIVDNLTTNVTNKPLSAAQGVAIKALIDALETVVANKANASDLTAHTGDTTVHITDAERTNWNEAMPKSGGTFTGTVVAAANNTGTTAMVRNIAYGSESSLASFASTANNGTILIYTS